jgi:hypothetical protein
MIMYDCPDQVGGRLVFFQKNWKKLTNDPWILDTIKGIKIEVTSPPQQVREPFWPIFSVRESTLLAHEVQELLNKGAVERTGSSPDQFLGHLFLRPKKDGSYRPVFNMKELNQFVRYEKFKMEGMPMLCTLLEKNDWMTKIDLKDAYFCLPIAHEHKKLFRFRWDNALFQFRVCPFGLASAPRIFTKILKPAMGFCRRLGIRLLIYLDDLIILNQNPENLTVDTNSIIWILQHLGFVINWNKSVPVPQQQLEYLGFTINSVALTLALPEDKVQNIRGKCQQLLPEKEVSARDLSKLIGKLTATVLAVLPAPLHFRQLQMLRTKALLQGSQNYGTKIELTSACRDELRWWIHYLNHWNGKSMVHSCPDLVITSDSSKVGWGAVCNQVTTQGQWSSDERPRHINALELMAVYFALKAFTKNKSDMHVHIRVDIRATQAQINKMGGPRSQDLLTITQEIWQYCLSRKITITAEYLPGVQNTEADYQSRVFRDGSNWHLKHQVVTQIENMWGLVSVDLFADRLNAHKQQYVSWKPDPHAMTVDAFSLSWSNLKAYAFPPFSLIGKCLAKIAKDQATLILITPAWQMQTWYPKLLEMTVEAPILLPPYQDLLTDPVGNSHPLILTKQLMLAAWKVSGRGSLQEAFRRTLLPCVFSHEDQGHNPLTKAPGTSGLAGVVSGKLMPFRPLWQM